MAIYEISLPLNTPNFEITTVIKDENLQIKIRSIHNNSYMDLTVNNNVIFNGLRCDANINLTENYSYKGIKGGLVFYSNSSNDVFYTEFGTYCKLYYITN